MQEPEQPGAQEFYSVWGQLPGKRMPSPASSGLLAFCRFSPVSFGGVQKPLTRGFLPTSSGRSRTSPLPIQFPTGQQYLRCPQPSLPVVFVQVDIQGDLLCPLFIQDLSRYSKGTRPSSSSASDQRRICELIPPTQFPPILLNEAFPGSSLMPRQSQRSKFEVILLRLSTLAD